MPRKASPAPTPVVDETEVEEQPEITIEDMKMMELEQLEQIDKQTLTEDESRFLEKRLKALRPEPTLRMDGQTLEQHIASGLPKETYPLPGFAARVENKPVVGVKTAKQMKIDESREVLKHPLLPGQQLFEAPDGYIIVGDADKAHVWYQDLNDGKGGMINPRR